MNGKKARGLRKEAKFHPNKKRQQRRIKTGDKITIINTGSRRRYLDLKNNKN